MKYNSPIDSKILYLRASWLILIGKWFEWNGYRRKVLHSIGLIAIKIKKFDKIEGENRN